MNFHQFPIYFHLVFIFTHLKKRLNSTNQIINLPKFFFFSVQLFKIFKICWKLFNEMLWILHCQSQFDCISFCLYSFFFSVLNIKLTLRAKFYFFIHFFFECIFQVKVFARGPITSHFLVIISSNFFCSNAFT